MGGGDSWLGGPPGHGPGPLLWQRAVGKLVPPASAACPVEWDPDAGGCQKEGQGVSVPGEKASAGEAVLSRVRSNSKGKSTNAEPSLILSVSPSGVRGNSVSLKGARGLEMFSVRATVWVTRRGAGVREGTGHTRTIKNTQHETPPRSSHTWRPPPPRRSVVPLRGSRLLQEALRLAWRVATIPSGRPSPEGAGA